VLVALAAVGAMSYAAVPGRWQTAVEGLVGAAEAAVRALDTRLRTALNLEFHRMLARMAHNPFLEVLAGTVTAITREAGRNMEPIANRMVMPLRRRLLAHLRARNVVAATAEMHTHLQRLEKHYLSQLDK